MTFYLSGSQASTLESLGCPDQLDGHLQGYDHGPGILQSFQGDSNVQPGGKQCLPEVETGAESSVIHL